MIKPFSRLAPVLLVSLWFAGTALAEGLATAPVERVETPRVYRLDGAVEAVNQTTIAAQTSGQVKAVLFDVDDLVEKGAVIVQLDDAEQQAGLSAAEANLRAATAKLQDASEAYQRIKGVYAKKLVAKAEMDKASAALKTARAQREAAGAALDQARQQYTYTQVKAPYTGIVTQRHVEQGEVARPGTPLMSGISLEHLRVLVDVPQSLIMAVRRYGTAQVKQPGDGWIDAKGLTVFPYADQASNTFRVRLGLPPGVEGFFPGMFVKVAFVTGMQQILAVPAESVVYRSEVTGVYVLDAKGRVELRHVRLGRRQADGRLAVLAGLEEGERVALDPIAAGVLLKRQRREEHVDHG